MAGIFIESKESKILKKENSSKIGLFVGWLVGWISWYINPFGYFMPKMLLFYLFFVGYGYYLHIISSDTFVGNWMFGIVVCVWLLLSGEFSISCSVHPSVCVSICGWGFWSMALYLWLEAVFFSVSYVIIMFHIVLSY